MKEDKQEDMPEPPSDNEVVSPPGTKTRSTRKRRRSNDDDEQSVASTSTARSTRSSRRRRRSNDDDSKKEEDAEMTDAPKDPSDDEESSKTAKKKKAKKVTKTPKKKNKKDETEAKTTEKPNVKVPAAKLRLPSKHTPGNLKETTKIRKTQPPTGDEKISEEPSRQLFPEIMLEQREEVELEPLPEETTVWQNIVETIANMLGVPSATAEEDEDVIVPEKAWSSSMQRWSQSCWTWFFLILFLHGFFWPCAIHPALDLVSRSSKPLTIFYKSLVTPTTNITDLSSEQWDALEQQYAAELQVLQDRLTQYAQSDQASAVSREASRHLKAITQRQKKLTELEKLANSLDASRPETIHALQAALEDRANLVVDISKWKSSFDVPKCELPKTLSEGGSLPEAPENALDEAELGPALQALITELSNLDDAGEANVWNWLEPYALKKFEESKSELEEALQKASSNGGSSPGDWSNALSGLQEFIDNRLEVELADGTGRVDYASLANGATIIREGTSPSLVDQLPLLNRVAALWGLRFYGYGPEAALTAPQEPGLCWSFTPTVSRHAAYGTLTIRLEAAIRMEAVTLEHLDDRSSAVKGFRLLGYTDPEARGAPVDLGTHEFSKTGPRRQTFDVPYVEQHIGALTLAMDSNWGGDYICLYRFRVHGSE